MAKQTLHIEYIPDFVLIGIVCHAKDYRLCFEINNKLEITLRKIEDLEVFLSKKKESVRFSLYLHTEENENKLLYIIGNRGPQGFLIPENKQIDYFVMLKGTYSPGEKEGIIKKLKEITIVMGAYDIDLKTIKSKENLFF